MRPTLFVPRATSAWVNRAAAHRRSRRISTRSFDPRDIGPLTGPARVQVILTTRNRPVLKTLEAVRPLTLIEMQDARRRIAGSVVRPDLGPKFPHIRLKLENLQATNSYKLRGAVNAVAMLSEAERKLGVWTISAGNAGQGVAYAARLAGVPCTVVGIETAPPAKIDRMGAPGAKLWPGP